MPSNQVVVYIHGKGGSASEAGRYETLFPDFDVIGFDYRAETPWEAKEEFTEYFDAIGKRYGSVLLIANSIGAFFAMNAAVNEKIRAAYFISPIVDMEKLITDRMAQAGITEAVLKKEKTVETSFDEPLSWEYLCRVRENPVAWQVPTHVLYGENDALTSLETVSRFVKKIGASLTVMPGGEHWFHTEAQMAFLDAWIRGTK